MEDKVKVLVRRDLPSEIITEQSYQDWKEMTISPDQLQDLMNRGYSVKLVW